MANRIETGINYIGSVINRTIGRAAWHEAMQRPASVTVPYEKRPSWSRGINKAMDHAAPVYALAQLLSPVTSRIMLPALDDDTESEKLAKRHPIIGYATILTPLIADVALMGACGHLSHSYAEFGAFLMIRNVAAQVGLDIGGAAIRGGERLWRHFKPTSPALLV